MVVPASVETVMNPDNPALNPDLQSNTPSHYNQTPTFISLWTGALNLESGSAELMKSHTARPEIRPSQTPEKKEPGRRLLLSGNHIVQKKNN